MLGTELPEVVNHLKQYDIEVSWIEQNGPQRVTRTTFGFDWQTAAVELSDLFQRSNNQTESAGSQAGRKGGIAGRDSGNRINRDNRNRDRIDNRSGDEPFRPGHIVNPIKEARDRAEEQRRLEENQ